MYPRWRSVNENRRAWAPVVGQLRVSILSPGSISGCLDAITLAERYRHPQFRFVHMSAAPAIFLGFPVGETRARANLLSVVVPELRWSLRTRVISGKANGVIAVGRTVRNHGTARGAADY